MILEGLVTTLNVDGSAHVSPMGPRVDSAMRRLVLRPFQTSTTFANLKRTGAGVFHVTDDVELLAETAIGLPRRPPRLLPAPSATGFILADACRWYAFRISQIDERQERAELAADVVAQGSLREFFGFNRAKHAVVEAAILATRTAILPADEILTKFRELQAPVDKTGGDAERRAFALLQQYVERACATPA